MNWRQRRARDTAAARHGPRFWDELKVYVGIREPPDTVDQPRTAGAVRLGPRLVALALFGVIALVLWLSLGVEPLQLIGGIIVLRFVAVGLSRVFGS